MNEKPEVKVTWGSVGGKRWVMDDELTRRFQEFFDKQADAILYGSVVPPNRMGAPKSRSMSHAAAFALATLGLPTSANPEQVRAAYRAAAHRHHPDVGGDAEEMKKVNEAIEALRKEGLA